MKENYHTHTYLCKHAIGGPLDYAREAVSLGFTHLGFSDHGPLENAGFPRMSLEEFYTKYLKEIELCQREYPDLKIYKGLEIEYFYGRDDYYRTLLKDLDYLVLGCHYYSGYTHENTSSYECNTKERLESYVRLAEDALNTGFFRLFAHPDFFLCGYPRFDEYFEDAVRRICRACIKNHVVLECNVAGYSRFLKDFEGISEVRYPNPHFFRIVSEFKDLEVIVSSDCHDPKLLTKYVEEGEELLSSLGIVPTTHILEKNHD